MEITFACTRCGARLGIEADAAGEPIDCPQCGITLTVPEKKVGPGFTVGGFRILELVGKGGMGQVFRAQQLSMDRQVALKILPPQFTVDEEAVQSFLNEVRMTARLDHPNIVTAFEAGEDEGVYYLAMAFIDGEPLSERLKHGSPFAEQPALELARKIASALAHAWDRHRILHRDVKPENILIDASGRMASTSSSINPSVDRV